MLAEQLAAWVHGYKAEGVQQDLGLAVQKLLAKRLRAIPSEVLTKIVGASPQQIDAWLDQVLQPQVFPERSASSA